MTASEIPASLDDLQQPPAAGSPGAPATDILASIRAVENVDEDKRKGEVLLAVSGLAESGQLDDEVVKLTVKDYLVRGRLLPPGEFNAVIRQASAARNAAEKASAQPTGQPTGDEIAAALQALGGELTGAEVLDHVAAFVGPFLALPSDHCLTVMVLWAAHTHAVHRFYVTPRLIFDSAEYGSGKTRALELLALVVFRPKMTFSTTTAALYRRLGKAGERALTVLFDETDAIFNPRTAPQYEDLRAVLNTGYKRGATVDRCVGDGASMDVAEFSVFAPVALAGLAGCVPRSIVTRSAAEIHMRKRKPTEKLRPFDEEEAEAEAAPLRTVLAGWIESVSESLGVRPAMPDGVTDRPAENWRALLAIADAAGGSWPDRARAACLHFVLAGENTDTFGVGLLRDIRHVFTTWKVIPAAGEDEEPVRVPDGFTDKLASTDIIGKLIALEDSHWGDLKGKPLDPARLKDELDRYQVDKGSIRIPDLDKPLREDGKPRTKSAKGYHVSGEGGLGDAWSRYLPDHGTYIQSALSGDSGDRGNGPGQGSFAADDSGDSAVTAVTPDEAVTARAVTVTAAATGSEPATSSVTAATAVTAKGGTHLSPTVALLERELGAQPIDPSANGQHDPDICATCGEAYGSPVHAITCAGYDPAT